MSAGEIHFVDTTIRDGHQSLWASNMTTGMILPIAENLDKAGFESIELTAGALFKKNVRELKEDPFELIREVSKRITETPLRLIASRINPFEHDPECMYRLFLELAAAAGMREIRISDPWNGLPFWMPRVKLARKIGLTPLVNLIFSISPRHTDEYYAERTRQAATLPVYRLCLKDPGGLLTPERARTLVPLVLKAAGDKYVELHTHCTTGLGPLVALEAIKAGIRTINTSLPPLANGPSLPSLYNVAANARALGYDTAIDEEILQPVSDHFTVIAEREGLPIGAPVEYDVSQYQHQVPGGMISNLAHQLMLVGLDDRLDEALEETARVRAELAFPVMVTPLSQFVGSQAAINIVVGQRYGQVTDQIIDYALGRYGSEGADEMDQNIKDRVLSLPRARELAARQDKEPTLKEMRAKFGGKGVSDEELILRWIAGRDEVETMRAAGPDRQYRIGGKKLVGMVRDLSGHKELNSVSIQKPGFSMTLGRQG